jgi:hypothetical protein
MADITLTGFKAQVHDLARPNRLWVQITGGTAAAAWQEEPYAFLAKSFSLPARTIGNIEVNWQGMKAKLAGDPTFEDFTMTFLNDYEFKVKDYFEAWLEELATMETNIRTDHTTYKAEVLVQQLGRDGSVLAEYTLKGAYPITMDAIELNQESADTVEEFNITFAYDYFERSQ